MKTKIKDVFRGWLPQQPSNFQRLRQHSTPIAIGLAVTVLTVSLFLVSSNFIAGYTSINPPPIAPAINGTASEQSIIEATETPQPTAQPLNVTNLTKEEALAIAMPLIEKYARENNRIVTGVTADFGMGPDDGERGGLTLEQVLVGNVTPSEAHNKFSYYPMWLITATFQWTEPQIVEVRDDNGTLIDSHWSEDSTWIVGYQVTLWADTGEIKSQGEMGVC